MTVKNTVYTPVEIDTPSTDFSFVQIQLRLNQVNQDLPQQAIEQNEASNKNGEVDTEETLADTKTGYKADNTNSAPEGFSSALIQRNLDQPNQGSIKQVVRACVDDGGAVKAAGGNSDETDETNNYEGFILSGVVTGSLHETLQGKNFLHNEQDKKETEEKLVQKREIMTEGISMATENKQKLMEKFIENLKSTNEHFYPFSTILK